MYRLVRNSEQNKSIKCPSPGLALTFYVWISLGFKQILPVEGEMEDSSPHVTEDREETGKIKIIYESYSSNTGFYTTHM